MVDLESEGIGVRVGERQRVGGGERIGHRPIQQGQDVVAQTETRVVVQDIDQVADDLPALENAARGVKPDRGEVEIIGVEGLHEEVGSEVEGAQAIGGGCAAILEQKDPRALRAYKCDSEIGDARIVNEQPDIQGGDNAASIEIGRA